MTPTNKIDFPETVMLIDAVLLNQLANFLKKNFEKMLKRPLPCMDVAQFIINLALDAAIPSKNKDIQILLVYDESTPQLDHCTPSVLDRELNGVAFQDKLGEFVFASISPEGMVSREELYFDLLRIISESSDVKRIITVPLEENKEEDIYTALEKIKNKDVTLFSMNQPKKSTGFTWQMLAYPIMQAFGVKGEELKN